MKMKLISFILIVFASFAAASDFSWKTFDIKTGPALGGWQGATMYGWSLSLVKPITPYLGVGAMLEVGKDLSMCEDCVNYNFEELSEGVFLNLNIPLSTHFSLVSNFMFLVHWEEGTVEDLYWDRFVPIVVFDEKGNRIYAYERVSDEDNNDYYFESFMFRSNLGISWRTSGKRFGVEFYPVDFAVVRGCDARMTFSLNAVFRLF